MKHDLIFLLLYEDEVMLISTSDYLMKRLDINYEHYLDNLVPITILFEVVGCLAAGVLSDLSGRRLVVFLSSGMSFIGVLVMYLSTNYTTLIISRIALGSGIGMGYLSIPLYIAELSPPSARSVLALFPEVLFNVGFLFASIVHLKLSKVSKHLEWLGFFALSAISSLVITLFLLVMPESPSWLMRQGHVADATRTIMNCTRRVEEAYDRINLMRFIIGVSIDDTRDVVDSIPREIRGEIFIWRELICSTPEIAKISLSVDMLQVIQQLTAINSLISSSTPLLVYSFITEHNATQVGLLCVMCLKTITLLAPMLMLDKYGHFRLLFISIIGTAVSLGLLGIMYFSIHSSHKFTTAHDIFAILCVFTFAGSFSLGLGPLPYIYNAEVFPYRLRAQGTSFAIAISRSVWYFMYLSSTTLYKWLPFGMVLTIRAIIIGALMIWGHIRESRQENID
ncbi:putative polyol transporter 1 [Mercurialis annua]|uniref:putative polyol transporter 1 n=1 Tax=Mercurialis annua TaxID=3986 RepID=UPI0024ADC55F|nr:putative polyol transporter 1 [Mercurialis annua]